MSDNKLATLGNDTTSTAPQHTITAVDIVLEPDTTMIQHAQAANAGLLKNFPKGYALGNEHAPHVSVMGGYVYTASLDKLFTAAGKVLASEKVTSWKLKAFKYYYIPLKEIGLGGIVVEPTADLIRLQKELMDATAPFMAPAGSGTAAAFATTPDDQDPGHGAPCYVPGAEPGRKRLGRIPRDDWARPTLPRAIRAPGPIPCVRRGHPAEATRVGHFLGPFEDPTLVLRGQRTVDLLYARELPGIEQIGRA